MKLKTLAYLGLITLLMSYVVTAHAQTFKVLHTFTCGVDGGYPSGGVTIRGSYLYGTTFECGYAFGTVYEIPRSGNNWGELIPILNFYRYAGPLARVVFGPDGHLYGTTNGGLRAYSSTVFDLIPPHQLVACGSLTCPPFWRLDLLYDLERVGLFSPGYGDLTFDQPGNIYGTTEFGGPRGGVVYELMRSGNTWTENTIYTFPDDQDGENPMGGVIFGRNGDLFGTTFYGGTHGEGTVFELTNVNGTWVETILYSFQNASDGENPMAGLVSDSSGNLYGATSQGGSGYGGTIFELVRSGNTYTFKLLYSLSAFYFDSCGPWMALTMDAAGNLYGTTHCEGASNAGSVFKLTNTQNGWVYTSLHDFTGGDDGGGPISNVTIDADGKLYGTASGSNAHQNYGVVWVITP